MQYLAFRAAVMADLPADVLADLEYEWEYELERGLHPCPASPEGQTIVRT